MAAGLPLPRCLKAAWANRAPSPAGGRGLWRGMLRRASLPTGRSKAAHSGAASGRFGRLWQLCLGYRHGDPVPRSSGDAEHNSLNVGTVLRDGGSCPAVAWGWGG